MECKGYRCGWCHFDSTTRRNSSYCLHDLHAVSVCILRIYLHKKSRPLHNSFHSFQLSHKTREFLWIFQARETIGYFFRFAQSHSNFYCRFCSLTLQIIHCIRVNNYDRDTMKMNRRVPSVFSKILLKRVISCWMFDGIWKKKSWRKFWQIASLANIKLYLRCNVESYIWCNIWYRELNSSFVGVSNHG